MQRRINGWQRLWIVFSALSLIITLFALEDSFPKASNYADTRLYGSIEAVGEYMEATTPGYSFEGSYTVRRKYYGKLTDDAVINHVHKKFKDKVDFTEIENAYKNNIQGLPSEQASITVKYLLWWLLTSATIYAFGFSVAWVIKGFRNP